VTSSGAGTPAASEAAALIEAAIDAIDERVIAVRYALMRYKLAVQKALDLSAAFDAFAAKLTDCSNGCAALLSVAAVREAIETSESKYVLYVKLESVAGAAAKTEKSLIVFGGKVTLTGYATASFVLAEHRNWTIAAADTLGCGVSIQQKSGSGDFSEWKRRTFSRLQYSMPVNAQG
jgi:hypothetical protein